MKWTYNKTCCYGTVPFCWLNVDHSATQLDKHWRSSTRTESLPLTRRSTLQPHFLPLCSSQSHFKEIFCTRRRWIQLRTLCKRYIIYVQSVGKIVKSDTAMKPSPLSYIHLNFRFRKDNLYVLNMQDCRTPSISQTPRIKVIRVTSVLIILPFPFYAIHKFIATVTKVTSNKVLPVLRHHIMFTLVEWRYSSTPP
jgi:hypothetical protein